jgi:hypothetical protein
MYSLVFAADMYATVFKADPLDPVRGKLYRDKILRVGGSQEEIDSLKASDAISSHNSPNLFINCTIQDFLGRPPNSEAFTKALFGTLPASSL